MFPHFQRRDRWITALTFGTVSLAWLVRPLSGQTLEGRVVSAEDQQPVATALVWVPDGTGEARAMTQADSLGRYRLSLPGPGVYAIQAARIGFQPYRSPPVEVSQGDVYTMDVALIPEPVPIPGVEVTVEEATEFERAIRGIILDSANGRPVPLAGVYLLDRDRDVVDVAMADSVGRYFLAVPDSGGYILFVQRFGYFETESPLLAIPNRGRHPIDIELRPEPIAVDPLTVSVSSDRLADHLKLQFGVNPRALFGFRVLQGARLEEAKLKGKFDPTNTLRWLYVPVSHGRDCVRINAIGRAVSVTSRGSRAGGFGLGAPIGTYRIGAAIVGQAGNECGGNLYVDDRWMPTDLLDTIDMYGIATVVLLPSAVWMYTHGYDFSQVGPAIR